MIAEEHVLLRFQEQADSIRESKKSTGIDARLQAGRKLILEEIEYLKKNDSEVLKECKEVQRESIMIKENGNVRKRTKKSIGGLPQSKRCIVMK